MSTASGSGSQTFGLADVLGVLRRRWRWVLGSVVVLFALALALSLSQERSYTASTTLLLQSDTENLFVGEVRADQIPAVRDREVINQLQVITSIGLRREVAKAYDGDLDLEDVTVALGAVGSDAVVISMTGSDAEEVARVANLYAEEYVTYRTTKRVEALVETSEEVRAQAEELEEERTALVAPLEELDALLAADPGDSELQAERDRVASGLAARLAAIDQTRETYGELLENLQLQVGLPGSQPAQIIDEAEVPTEPVSPKPVRDGVVGLMLGLGLGVVLAFAREFLDHSVLTADDVEAVVEGRYPVLAVIPEASEIERRGLADPAAHSAVAEACRALRTSVKFAELDRDMRVIQVTSGSQGEGKTMTAANLAVMLTQAGHRVAVVCCDLRRPQIHEHFGATVSPGLADVILGDRELAEAVRSVDDNGLLFLLPAGTTPPNPSELLGSGRAERVIAALAEEMDYVLVDSTPILPVTDALVVSRFVDATIVVAAAGDTTRHELERTVEALEQISAPTIGIVLNRAKTGDRNAYGYTYGQSGYTSQRTTYGGNDDPRTGRRSRRSGETAPPEDHDAGMPALS